MYCAQHAEVPARYYSYLYGNIAVLLCLQCMELARDAGVEDDSIYRLKEVRHEVPDSTSEHP